MAEKARAATDANRQRVLRADKIFLPFVWPIALERNCPDFGRAVTVCCFGDLPFYGFLLPFSDIMPESHPTIGGEPDKPLWASGDALTGCFELAAELGFKVEPYLQRNGIDPANVAASRGLISVQAMSDFFEDVAANECANFGFLLGKSQPPLHYGMISQIPLVSPTVGESLRNFIAYQQLSSQSSNWRLVEEGDIVFMRRLDVATAPRAMPQLLSFSLTLAVSSLRHVMQSEWAPIGVYVMFEPGDAAAELSRYFGAPVFGGSQYNELAFDRDLLSAPVPTSDPALLAVLKNHFDGLRNSTPGQSDLKAQVYHLIRTHLGAEQCNLDWVADRLAMHPRAVQRTLEAEGTSFRLLLRDARLELAEYLLRLPRIRISEISSMLGYSNVSAFTRAFEQTKGMPPSRLRSFAGETAV